MHCFAAAATVEGTLVFDDNNPNAVFIIRIGTTLTTGANTNVWMLNGTGTNKVFWQIGDSAMLGANSSFSGNLMADTSIGMGSGVSMTGRAIALNGAVTLDSDQISIPMADVAAGKFTFGNVVPGGTFTYHIDVFNRGAVAAEQVTLTDPLPSQLTFVSSDTGCTAVGQLVSCPTFAVLEPGDGSIFRIVVRLNPAYIGKRQRDRQRRDDVDREPRWGSRHDASNPSSQPCGAERQPVDHEGGGRNRCFRRPDFHLSGDRGQRRPSTAVNVSVTDTLPAQSHSYRRRSRAARDRGGVTCRRIASLAPAATATFDLVVRLDPAYVGTDIDIQNVASVSSGTPIRWPATTASYARRRQGRPSESDLQPVKSVSNRTAVTPGTAFYLHVLVTNNGPAVLRRS